MSLLLPIALWLHLASPPCQAQSDGVAPGAGSMLAQVSGLSVPTATCTWGDCGWVAVGAFPLATLERDGSRESIHLGMEIAEGDRIRTEGARVRLRLAPERWGLLTKLLRSGDILLNPGTDIQIRPGWDLDLLAGAIYAEVHWPMEVHAQEFDTAVRGTRLFVETAPPTATVYEGTIEVSAQEGQVHLSRRLDRQEHRQRIGSLKERQVALDARGRITHQQPAYADRFRMAGQTWLVSEPRFQVGLSGQLMGMAHPTDPQARVLAGGLANWQRVRLAEGQWLGWEWGLWRGAQPVRVPIAIGLETQKIPLLQPDPSGPSRWGVGVMALGELAMQYDDLKTRWFEDLSDKNVYLHAGGGLSLRWEHFLFRRTWLNYAVRVGYLGSTVETVDKQYQHWQASIRLGLGLGI